jgi:hypothetical protein
LSMVWNDIVCRTCTVRPGAKMPKRTRYRRR